MLRYRKSGRSIGSHGRICGGRAYISCARNFRIAPLDLLNGCTEYELLLWSETIRNGPHDSIENFLLYPSLQHSLLVP